MKVERLVIVTADAAPWEALSTTVGADAARLADAFLHDTLAVCLHPEVRAAIWLVPRRDVPLPDAVATVRQLPAASRETLLEHGFAEGYKYVCFLGTDTPHLPTSFIQEAFGRLTPSRITGAGVEAVWGPTDAGDFALIASRQPLPEVLSATTPQEAEAQSQARGIGYHLLPRWYRVTTPESLRRLAQDVRREVIFAPETAKVLADLRL